MGLLDKIKGGEKLRFERKVSPYTTMKELMKYIAYGNKADDHIRITGGGSGTGDSQDLKVNINSDHVNMVDEFLDVSVGMTKTVDLMRRVRSYKPSTQFTGGLLSGLLDNGFITLDFGPAETDDLIAAQVQIFYENIEGDIDIGLVQPKQRHYKTAEGIDAADSAAVNDLARYLLKGRGIKQLKGRLQAGDSSNDNVAPSIKTMIAGTSQTYVPSQADVRMYMDAIPTICSYLVNAASVYNVGAAGSTLGMSEEQAAALEAMIEQDRAYRESLTAIEEVVITYVGVSESSGEQVRIPYTVSNIRRIGEAHSGVGVPNASTHPTATMDATDALIQAHLDAFTSEAQASLPNLSANILEIFFLRQLFIGLRDQMGSNFATDGIPVAVSRADRELLAQDTGMTSDGSINSNPSSPDRLMSPTLSVIVVPSLDANINTRNTGHVALFSSGIPTVEMSLATPYLRLQFEVAKASVLSQGSDAQAALGTTVTFLGDGTISYGSADWGLQTGVGPGVQPNDAEETAGIGAALSILSDSIFQDQSRDTRISLTTRSAMEMFTSPQTMVNMNINSLRSDKVLDPTQPLMSLDSVQIKEYLSGHGLIGFKRATVTLTLHDRTRLREVAHFIAPAQFGRVTSEIEFGWSHPHSDPATGSPYGKYLNSLRNVAKYRLIKGNYNMDSSGQIKITLELGTTGGEESKHVHACTGKFVELKLVESILDDINTIYRQQKLSTGHLSAEIRDFTTLYEPSTSASSMMVDSSMLVHAETIYRDMIQGDRTPEAAAAHLGDMLKRFIEAPGSNYSVRTPAVLMAQALDNLAGNNSITPDPFLSDLTMGVTMDASSRSIASALRFSRNTFRNQGESYVSLGKAMTCLIGKPLAASRRFDEVQMIFYGANDSAGAMANYDLSSFPINISDLRERVNNYMEESGNITVNTIIRILTAMTNTGSAAGYGFSDIYDYNQTMTAMNELRRQQAAEDENENWDEVDQTFNLNEALVQRMYQTGMFRPRFKIPVVKVMFESGPLKVCDDEGQPTGQVDETTHILRVHVYDRNATAHPGEQIILDALSEGQNAAMFNRDTVVAGRDSRTETVQQRVDSTINAAYSLEGPSHTSNRDIFKIFASLAPEAAGEWQTTEPVAETPNPQDGIRVPVILTDRNAIHEFIKSRVPTVQFGTAFSPFSEVTISGMSSGGTFDALLSNQFRERSDPQVGQGSDPLISEVTVVPVTAKAAGLGNPMFHPGQEFYLDLKTGTTADNIFTVRAVTHNISPGTFTSDVEFGPAGSFSSVSSIRANLVSSLAVLAEAASHNQRDGIFEIPRRWTLSLQAESDERARVGGGALSGGGYVDPETETSPIREYSADEISQFVLDDPDIIGVMERGGNIADHQVASVGDMFDQAIIADLDG